jgi:hypothetical protein
VWFFSLLWFTLCPFVTKRGSNCCFGPGMYFQTGQVIFVPEWPKGEFVSILALFCVWTKSLMCNDAANRDSSFQSEVRRISKFPVSRPDDVSSRPDAHLSTVPSVRTTCHSVRTSDRQASPVRMTCFFRPDTYIVSRSFCANLLRPDVSAARPNAYQFSNGSLILSKVSRKGRSINHLDDVVSRPDAYLRKARISIQNEPSGHLTAVVRTLVHRIW